MIHDFLSNSGVVLPVNTLFAKAFEFLKATNFSTLEPGKYILEDDKLYLTLMEVEGKIPEMAKMEAHRKYIDIQYVVEGTERMGWAPLNRCTDSDDGYNSEKDVIFFNDKPTSYVTVNKGEFVVFFPNDVHAPCIGDGNIKKVVVKVLV